MFSNTTIDTLTIQAYLETEYRVHGDTPAHLRVGSHCPELPEMVRETTLNTNGSERVITTVDLFCGAGGFAEGFSRVGYNCAYAVDFDEQAETKP